VSPEHRRYLFVQTAIGAAIVNALINGGIGWAATRGLVEFPAWKTPGVAGDLVATAFGVAFGTCFGAALQAKLDLKSGRVTVPTTLSPFLERLTARRPSNLWARASMLGVLAVPVFAPPALLLLSLSGVAALDRGTFIGVKAGFSAFEGALLTPFILLGALLDRSDARAHS
jgi:hypothetical protein